MNTSFVDTEDFITREAMVVICVVLVALLIMLGSIFAAAVSKPSVPSVQIDAQASAASPSHAGSLAIDPAARRARACVAQVSKEKELVAESKGENNTSPKNLEVGANAVTLEDLVAKNGSGEENTTDLGMTEAEKINALLAEPSQPNDVMGRSLTTVDAMVKDFEASGQPYPSSVYTLYGAPTIRDWCEQCYEEAVAEGVRAEVLFAQSMHETGWLQFGGQVVPEQCNFGGLGATNDGAAGGSFPDVRTGLRAQVQHLKAYASTEALKNDLVDERFDLVARGSAPTVQDLGGKWAVPGYTYGDAIMVIVDRIVS